MGLNGVALAFVAPCLGFPLVFHRMLTPGAPVSGGLVLGVLTCAGSLLFAMVVAVVAMAAIVEGLGAMGIGEDGPSTLVPVLLLLVSVILLLALHLTAPALSFHDRRLRGLRAWRTSLKHFGVFLATAVMLSLCLIALLIAATALVSIGGGLAHAMPRARPFVEGGLVALACAYGLAIVAGAMADMTRQTLGNSAEGLAGVFD